VNRAAIITDIHGNLSALEATFNAIDEIGVDATYCGGDLVGYGPHPNEVCRLIEDRGIPTIYGNYDYAIARELGRSRLPADPPGARLAAEGQRIPLRGQTGPPVRTARRPC
jgi:predicted phosphodiesterase